ncbi:MAG: glycosyltransferase [Bacteroidia bacterium]|nr:glycosyltransferase [Bacteroidia bacterium]
MPLIYNPLISIIVVSYNQSIYLAECLNSIAAQTYINWELIVADDFSSDNSTEVFDNWLFENKIIAKKNYHTQNKGFCATLNECIDLAKGEYVKILAADDFLHPHYFERVIQHFSILDENYRLVFSDSFVVNSQSKITSPTFITKPIPTGYVHKELLIYNFVPALTAMIIRKTFDELGKFDVSILIEDWEYWLRISQKYKLDYINEPLAYYRMHENNISKNSEKMLTASWQIMMKYASEKSHRKIINKFAAQHFYDKSLNNYGIDLYRNYRYRSAWLLYALKFRPIRSIVRFLLKI